MSAAPWGKFDTECQYCKSTFKVVRSRLTKAKYCSKDCMTKSLTLNEKFLTCQHCGIKFKELAKHRDARKRYGEMLYFCSKSCQYANKLIQYPIGTKRICSNSGYVWIKLARNKWRVEHRVIAEEIIGRKLNYNDEPILHINGRHADNSPENLYVCANISELNVILKSYTAPYPRESNLKHLKRQ